MALSIPNSVIFSFSESEIQMASTQKRVVPDCELPQVGPSNSDLWATAQRPRLSGYNGGPTAARRCLCRSCEQAVHAVAVYVADAQTHGLRGKANGNDSNPQSTGSSFSFPRTPAAEEISTTTKSSSRCQPQRPCYRGRGTAVSARAHARAHGRARRPRSLKQTHRATEDDAPCRPPD